MRIEEIKVAQNGFVLKNDLGEFFVAKSLAEAVQLVGELPPAANGCHYAPGHHSGSLSMVRQLAMEGRKIDSIKVLRDMFTHRMGLREAKEIVEILVLGDL